MKYQTKRHYLALLAFAMFCLAFVFGANAQTLVHRYSFQDPAGSTNFVDSVGGANWDGSLNNQNGGNPQLTGSALVLDGQGDFAQLPAGIMSNYTQISVEFWADIDAGNPTWTRVFSFGSQNGSGQKNSGIDYCPYAGGNYQNLDALNTNGVDAYANNNSGLLGLTNVHVTVVVDPVNNTMYYYNGTTLISQLHGAPPPLSQMNDAYDLIGRSLYDIDPTLAATIHEFRIYNGALSESSVALNDTAGSSLYLTNAGTINALRFTSPVNPLTVNQTVQQSVFGDFSQVTNLNLVLYGGVTYTSGNTNVLTISTNGVVKGIGVGTTTVT
ncbi:MAG TPA: LamG-like jellyroll fold domain-containing protein, partial [Verrucomicrobiae bacterium]|nr:LamG-like jellyroll fold domain-containing protein [Verrucomicrobiae bacterium]